MDAYIEEMNAVHRRRELYFGVSYMKKYNSERKMVARAQRWLQETEEQTKKYCVGVSILSRSAGFRFILSAVYLVKPMPIPSLVTGRFSEAIGFARKQCGNRGLPLPSTIPNPFGEDLD